MKTVGLVSAKGEGKRIAHCLQAMAPIVDEIVYLDDGSPDDTLEWVKLVAEECRVTRILERHDPLRDEGRDRNLLLRAGREIGGDRFLVLDADKAFAANASEYMRTALETLQPGESIAVPWTHLWRSAGQYRVDSCVWVGNWRVVAFGDDGYSWYPNQYLHVPRVPVKGEAGRLPPETVFLHFQFVYWPNVLVKQTWYKFLERIRTGRSVEDLNRQYGEALDERGLLTEASKAEWFFPFFNEADWMTLCEWRIDEMRRWRQEHGSVLDGLSSCPEVD